MNQKMNFNATWSMAVGGMIGGGIFSVLGVVIQKSGAWAWLSFTLSGVIALLSAHSYNQLSLKYQESGGAFTFLREINHKGFAGSLSWVLVFGYVLTISVYAFTFGEYIAHVFNTGGWLPRVLSAVVIGTLVFVNTFGARNTSKLEIVTVYGKLIVLLGLSAIGLYVWSPEMLTQGIEPRPWTAAFFGAASIFMAYEGFQLLSYDYKELKNPDRTLPKATLLAVVAVIFIYILVTLGATMLVGAEKLVQQKEVALSAAGEEALGSWGVILVTLAAAFSTASAINATLFSTARLMESVSEKKDLPDIFAQENKKNVPVYSVIFIGIFATALSLIGNLEILVDSASIVFLFTFGVVNLIAFYERIKYAYLSLLGVIMCAAATLISLTQQLQNRSLITSFLIFFVMFIFIGRHWFFKKHQKNKA